MVTPIPVRRLAAVGLLLAVPVTALDAALEVQPPVGSNSVRFAVLGDSGTGGREQYELGEILAESRTVFPFDFAIMLGDNIYGRERPDDFVKKFERPYKPLLDGGVNFYASLGNHDDPNQRFYKPFNMNGERYYTFKKGDVRFYALDSNYMDDGQLDWLEKALARASEPWKIAFFHHPLYSSGGRHGSDEDLRAHLEPLFVEHGVNAVFAGHEHFYERIKPQKGIYHFTSGAAAKLRRGNIRESELTAAGFDTDRSFMLVEIAGSALHFQVISRRGQRVDSGVLERLRASARSMHPVVGVPGAPWWTPGLHEETDLGRESGVAE